MIGGEVTEQAPIQFDVTTCFGRSNDTFATCSVDKAIHVCQIGRDSPLRTFKGHSGDVNTIRWDPSGALLFLCCLAFVSRVSANVAQQELSLPPAQTTALPKSGRYLPPAPCSTSKATSRRSTRCAGLPLGPALSIPPRTSASPLHRLTAQSKFGIRSMVTSCCRFQCTSSPFIRWHSHPAATTLHPDHSTALSPSRTSQAPSFSSSSLLGHQAVSAVIT